MLQPIRILLLTAVPLWHPGTLELIRRIQKLGVSIQAVDIFHGRYLDSSGEVRDYYPYISSPFLRKIWLRLIRGRLLRELQSEFDVVDIHFVEAAYGRHFQDFIRPLVCTLFGSDLFRTTAEQKKRQYPVFRKASRILLGENMTTEFNQHFGDCSSKLFIGQYGTAMVDRLTSLERSQNRGFLKVSDDRIVITCGYNGKSEQQHLQIIETLVGLPAELRENLLLVIPATYGLQPEYKAKLLAALKDSGLSFELLTEFLSEQEMLDLRVGSDLTINMQTTDALASSVKEAFAAGDLLIVGDWLPYDLYKEMGLHFHQTPFDELLPTLIRVLPNLNEERAKCKQNRPLIWQFSSWESVLPSWRELYDLAVHEGQQ